MNSFENEESITRETRILKRLGRAANIFSPLIIYAFGPSFRSSYEDAVGAIEEIHPNAEVAMPALLSLFMEKVETSRYGEARAITTYKKEYKKLIPIFILLADNDNKQIKNKAITFLGFEPYSSNKIPCLVKALSTKDKFTQINALKSLHNILHYIKFMDNDYVLQTENAKFIAVCRDLLNDERLCKYILDLLIIIGPQKKELLPDIINIYNNKNHFCREKSIAALGQIGPHAKAVLPNLRANLEDTNWRIRGLALSAISKIDPNSEKTLTMLTKAYLASEKRELNINARYALKNLGKTAALALAENIFSEDAVIRKKVYVMLSLMKNGLKFIVPIYIRNLRHENDKISSEAVRFFRGISNIKNPEKYGVYFKEVIPGLMDIFDNCNEEISEEILASLCNMGAKARPAIPRLIMHLNENRMKSYVALYHMEY